MNKPTPVKHESWRLDQKSPSCDVYMPKDKQLATAHREQDGSFFIVPGLGSVKADYGKLGRCLAGMGYTVYSPNCNEPVSNSERRGALDRRAETVVESVREWGGEGARLLPHSLGAPVTVKALFELGVIPDSANKKLERACGGSILSATFMQPAGFDRHGYTDFYKGLRFYFGEAIPRTAKLLPDLFRDPRDVYERLDIAQRRKEVQSLWDLPRDFMVNGIAAAHAGGLAMSFLLGPKDKLTRPEPIRSSVEPILGSNNVIDIHPKAGHLSAQTHPDHVANLILANTVSRSGDFTLAQAA
ncbi:MAG: alpha/beta hydrolase [bacterium]|nr:alpha/beta hydrolase [bacterium]